MIESFEDLIMYKILIVEDDFTIAHSMSSHLSKWDFDTKCIEDFHSVIETFQEYEPDLVLMDVTLPCYNGFHWCSEIRKVSNVPIIFVSSISDNMNIVMAINMGGDEYIEKPFDINVLTAKVQALLRRTYGLTQKKDTLDYRDLSLNLNSSNLCCNAEEISLSKNEYLILKLLMERHNHIVSRDELMEVLWGNDEFIDDNTLTVNVTRLRKKLESIGVKDFIVTKKGIGYMVV